MNTDFLTSNYYFSLFKTVCIVVQIITTAVVINNNTRLYET